MSKNEIDIYGNNIDMDNLYKNSVELIKYARSLASNQVNIIQLMTYYSLGKWIVDVQQNGNERAEYGKQIIKNLSEKLNQEFGKGFSEDTLKNARKFYLTYKNRISETLFSLFAIEKSETVFPKFYPYIVGKTFWTFLELIQKIPYQILGSIFQIDS